VTLAVVCAAALAVPSAQAAGQTESLHPRPLHPRLAEAIGYYTGTGGQVDDARAHDLLLEAVADDDVLARMWLARCYSRGRMLFERDEDRARELARTVLDEVRGLATEGSGEATFLIGTAYAEALGVDADPARAIAWYHRAAQLGNVLAQHNLGNAYRSGDGVVQDAGIAAFWYQQAGRQGDALPAFWLGQMFEQGEGVAPDRDEALRWYGVAAERGNTRAQEALARLQSR
jgi:TPR repeat protein